MEALEIMNHRMFARFWGRKPYSIAKKLIDSSDSVIVDPFGGSGSIVLTSLEMGKKVIYSDINPYTWLVVHIHIACADEFLSV
jgi:adenine-specific DNA methylase